MQFVAHATLSAEAKLLLLHLIYFGSKLNVGVTVRKGSVAPNIFIAKMKIKVEHNEKILYTEVANTTRKDSVCSMKDNITKLLGLEDVIVKNVYEDTSGCHVEIDLPRRKHRCPRCGTMTDRIHDYRMQKVKDLDTHGVRTYLHVRKRRYFCPSCGKRFFMKITAFFRAITE